MLISNRGGIIGKDESMRPRETEKGGYPAGRGVARGESQRWGKQVLSSTFILCTL